MSDALPYMGGTRLPLLGVKLYLNNYLAIKTCLHYSRKRVQLATPANLGLRIILQLFGHTNMSSLFPYTRVTRNPRRHGVKNYLNNYFAMYTWLTRFRIRVELASPAYLGLSIIYMNYLPCIHV